MFSLFTNVHKENTVGSTFMLTGITTGLALSGVARISVVGRGHNFPCDFQFLYPENLLVLRFFIL